ncbi:tissue factor pathway inhibitor isoform X3 [Coturnix japonica]|uniref:tissue factor pathway inhibitor isoform X3 n=1 Tax=Coturnix japonica TaxID=93934 RepID=UPI0013A5BFA4|nr:tissue factor pathway inhibitor isoform X3 [Coturnix japonica]
MKGRKRGWFLAFSFILLFVYITGHATDDSDDGEEEDVLGVPLPPLKLGHSDCALKADEGPCKAIHMRFYFNIRSQLPLEVMIAKIGREKPNLCYHDKDPGICRGFFSRYFYNKETKKCELFMYGGCLGNRNNFRSLEECQATCQGNPKLMPVVPNEERPTHMNSSSPEEEPNQLPGIFVNLSPTAPNEEESHTVNSSYPQQERKKFPSSFEPPPIPSLCLTPMDKGLCRAKETRFFYNYSTGRCRPFTYSGCGGNENNFTSRKSCLRICRKGFIKREDGRRLIRIKKKKKQSRKTKGEGIIHGRIQL